MYIVHNIRPSPPEFTIRLKQYKSVKRRENDPDGTTPLSWGVRYPHVVLQQHCDWREGVGMGTWDEQQDAPVVEAGQAPQVCPYPDEPA